MTSFQQMDEFMYDYVLYTILRFLGEFKVDPDAFCPGIAGTPSRLHAFHTPVVRMDADYRLPLRKKTGYDHLELFSIPLVEDAFAPLRGRLSFVVKVNKTDSVLTHKEGSRTLDNVQPISLAEPVYRLSVDHLPLALPGLIPEAFLLLSNPSQTRDDGVSNRLIPQKDRHAHLHFSIRRVHREMNGLHGFPSDKYFDLLNLKGEDLRLSIHGWLQ